MLTALAALVLVDGSRLQTGTTWSGQELVRYVNRASEIDETHQLKLSFKVTGKEDGMWVVERSSELLNTLIEKTWLGPPPVSMASTAKLWLSPKGFLLSMKPYDKGVFALDRLIHFWLPENQPTEWTVDLATSEDAYTAKARAEFKRVESSTAGSAEYSFHYLPVEDARGVSASGRMTFDVKSGRLMKAKIDAKRVYPPMGVEPADVTLTYTDSTLIEKR